MACSLTLNGRELPCKKTAGGLKYVYFAQYQDDMSVANAALATWYQYDVKGASSLETSINGSRENNSIFYTQTVTLQLPLLDSTTQDEIKLLASNKPHIVVEDYNGQQWLVGLEHGADLTGGTLATGANLGDFSGFTLTFEALEKEPPTSLSAAVSVSGTQITPAVSPAS